jgi:hypothetical protein
MSLFLAMGLGGQGFRVLFDYPTWFLLFCLLCGGAYAGLLYYRNSRDGFSRTMSWVAAVFRFLSVSLLAFLLLGPLVERVTRQVEDPLLIFAQDNSGSVVLHAEAMDVAAYLEGVDRFLDAMEGRYQVRSYTFGEAFRASDSIGFEEKVTDISEVFSGIDQHYSNRNIGAVVVASDGLYNRGINPLYVAAGKPYPVYAIALGDTTPRRDLLIGRVNHNRLTYLGNDFPVEVVVEARQGDGRSSRLTISRAGEILFSRVLDFTGDHDIQTIAAELTADAPGMQRYRAAIAPVEDEVSLANNTMDFYIDVIDGRQQVLILSHAPHPDVGALKMALEENENYEVTVSLFDSFDGNLEAYNMLVLHQLPGPGRDLRGFVEQVAAAELSCLFIIGQQTDLAAFSQLRNGLAISPRSDAFTETLPALEENFSLFSVPETTKSLLPSLPPLFSPFARYTMAAGTQAMLNQRIGQVVSDQPLLSFSRAGGWKTGVISGEGIWRWRLSSYARTGSHAAFDELINRVVQYLSVREDRSLFRVHAQAFLYENEEVRLEAELYNRSYELVNEPGVSVEIIGEDGQSFSYEMSRTSNAYQLVAGSFPPGEYSYEASTNFGGERFAAGGRFTVSPLNLEELRTIADHNVLFQLAEQSGGTLFHPGQWEELADHLMGREDVNPVMYARKTFDELINIKALFFVILLLLAGEWFMRKRSGSY